MSLRRLLQLRPTIPKASPDLLSITPRRSIHHAPTSTGGLLRTSQNSRLQRRRPWPFGSYSVHAVPAIRSVSFARSIPSLFIKLIRLPALLGGAAVGGVAYLQYQATQAGNYAAEVFRKASDSATTAAKGAYSSVWGVAEQAKDGWDKTTKGIGMPEWLQRMLQKNKAVGGEGGPNGEGRGPKQSRGGAAVAAGASTGAAFGYTLSSEDDDRTPIQEARDDQMMVLTKKMIEIRSILQTIGQSGALTLPSIVVIGSQSSGKSSVLEAIVGHEFLPKGSNMVTRRPIELTLVNTPEVYAEYGEFPALGLGKITDFSQIQRTLTDLNLAVPPADCVSDDPIQLSIYSPNVPDLSMIDLPGYIQVSGADQPPELKQKIADLCDKYIQPPNVILAISAADVDLANSTALRSSRRVDPRGERTIGVVTKMDLVDPRRGVDILTDRKYPLRLGYVGVITRVPQTGGLFSRGSGNITTAITKNESAYFQAHPLEFDNTDLSVGTTTLRKKLMQVLEQTMASSLQGTSDAIRQELEEATYEFKVQYNDRPLSAESYLAESLDAFKHSFKEFAESFGRPQLREILKQELDQRVLDLLAQRYWNKPIEDLTPAPIEVDPLSDLPKASEDNLYWRRKLDASTSTLTKIGIGRLATTSVANALQARVDQLVEASTFAAHPFAQEAIREASSSILNDRFYSTSDQVENCIKPYKFEIEVEDFEWSNGRQNIKGVLKNEFKACEAALKSVQDSVGGKRRMNDVVAFIERVRKGDVVLEGNGSGGAGGYSAALLQKGREALFLSTRAGLIQMRLAAVSSSKCASKDNKYQCPEIFLDVVSSKLTSTAVLFLNVELLSEFYYNFPRQLDARLGRHLSAEEVERFAREDQRVKGHLDVIRRKELLELVLAKMDGLRGLEGRVGREVDGAKRSPRARGERKGWGLF
ncbi:dynamin-like GTPase mgm1 [Agyrium rufum]|nr:dynamin-like GTPase mgm1 [Agyrium rufum]